MADSEEYRILLRGGEGEITEKKSRFIASIAPAESAEEAEEVIANVRKRYYDARHHCPAYRIGEHGEISRCSDDGEPSGTAGRPILDVLCGEGLHNVCAVVTRYFGGTLLGTGGLVRAYTAAVREGLKNCGIVTVIRGCQMPLTVDYGDLGKVQYLLGKEKIRTDAGEFGADVRLTALVPTERADDLAGKLTDITNGRIRFGERIPVRFGLDGGNPVIFGENAGKC